MARKLRTLLVGAVLLSLMVPTMALADSIQWEGATWEHFRGEKGSYVDSRGSFVFTNGAQTFFNSTMDWGDWVEVSFIDPGVGQGWLTLNVYDGPKDNSVPRAWIGSYLNNTVTRMWFQDDPNNFAAGLEIPRQAGEHTLRIENTSSGIRFLVDDQVYDTLLNWDRTLSQYTYETVVGPLANIITVQLSGADVAITSLKSGTLSSGGGSGTPEPGTLLLVASVFGIGALRSLCRRPKAKLI